MITPMLPILMASTSIALSQATQRNTQFILQNSRPVFHYGKPGRGRAGGVEVAQKAVYVPKIPPVIK